MAINKVVFGNNTLIDLTSDTIGADKLLKGFTAHDASGASIVGTYEGGSVDGYTINLFASSSELYGQSIVVSYEGQRVTTIQFSNAGTASIVVQEEGAYNFAVSYGGLTYYCDVNVVSAVRTYNETIYYYPNGSTVTPINDVQIWISCADVRDKNYTTLAEVFADNQLLATLMSSENAVNYLVRSKQFIGNEALVPIMTSNTTPSGECIGSTPIESSLYYAFDGDESTKLVMGRTTTPNTSDIGYDFGEPTRISSVRYVTKTIGNQVGIPPTSFIVQGSNDNSNWNDLGSYTCPSVSDDWNTFTFPETEYRYYRLHCTDRLHTNGYYYTQFNEIQFSFTGICQSSDAMTYIGLNNYASNTLLADETWCNAICNSEYWQSVINAVTPDMTGYTTPSGEVIYSNEKNATYVAWKAFDGDATTQWEPNGTTGNYVGYDFGYDVRLVKFSYKGINNPSYPTWVMRDFKIQGSADKLVFNDVESFTYTASPNNQDFQLSKASDPYRCFRQYCVTGAGETDACACELKFYGRKDIPEPIPVQRQTNYYPFSSQTLIGGSNLAYGGVSFSSFKLSGRDLEEIQEIKIKGRLYISRGSTQMKKCRMDYTIAGEKDGKWCFWNGTSWDITDVNITERYGNGFYDARGWVNVKEISSNVATVKSELIDLTIPISIIVASAKSNGINLEFANTFLNTAYWYGNFVEILGDSCFSLGIFAGRFANTTNAFVYYGFSVDQVNTTSDDLDTVSELANNSPQVEIEWK